MSPIQIFGYSSGDEEEYQAFAKSPKKRRPGRKPKPKKVESDSEAEGAEIEQGAEILNTYHVGL